MKILAVIVSALGIATTVFGQTGKSAREIASDAFRSVVLLVVEDDKRQPLSLGSGFIVQEGLLVTNAHVIDGATTGYAKLIGKPRKYEITGIVARNELHDLALLKVEGMTAPEMAIADSTSVAVGDPIYAIGNPKGLEGTFSAGIISGVRKLEHGALLQITAPISPGSSGGPVVNVDGQVVGIAVATFRGGQNLNFAVPASEIRKLLSEQGPLKSLGGQTHSSGRSILNEVGGTNLVTGVEGTAFNWSGGGMFAFTFQNKLRETVKDIQCLVIFYNAAGVPVDFAPISYKGPIPAGLGKRVRGDVDLSTAIAVNAYVGTKGNVEFRILGFEIVTE